MFHLAEFEINARPFARGEYRIDRTSKCSVSVILQASTIISDMSWSRWLKYVFEQLTGCSLRGETRLSGNSMMCHHRYHTSSRNSVYGIPGPVFFPTNSYRIRNGPYLMFLQASTIVSRSSCGISYHDF